MRNILRKKKIKIKDEIPERLEEYTGAYSPKPFTNNQRIDAILVQMADSIEYRNSIWSLMAESNNFGKSEDFTRHEVFIYWSKIFKDNKKENVDGI